MIITSNKFGNWPLATRRSSAQTPHTSRALRGLCGATPGVWQLVRWLLVVFVCVLAISGVVVPVDAAMRVHDRPECAVSHRCSWSPARSARFHALLSAWRLVFSLQSTIHTLLVMLALRWLPMGAWLRLTAGLHGVACASAAAALGAMASKGPRAATVIINHDKFQVPQLSELKAELESKVDERKIEAVKQAILLMLNGEPLPQLLMPVIQVRAADRACRDHLLANGLRAVLHPHRKPRAQEAAHVLLGGGAKV